MRRFLSTASPSGKDPAAPPPQPDPSTVYIVTGYLRSGTSVMVESMEAGGMPASYTKRKHHG